jgi:hypothetical protein
MLKSRRSVTVRASSVNESPSYELYHILKFGSIIIINNNILPSCGTELEYINMPSKSAPLISIQKIPSIAN